MGWIKFVPSIHFFRGAGMSGFSIIWWDWSVSVGFTRRNWLRDAKAKP